MPSPSHVVLLRGINVGGRNKLPMKTLVRMLEQSGAEQVRTLIQSGNAVFAAPTATARALPSALRAALAEELGNEIPVIHRSARQWRALLTCNPFLEAGHDPRTLAVAFLDRRPNARQLQSLEDLRSLPDSFEVHGREVYLHYPNGMARTRLGNDALDRRLGAVSTVRNWNTTRKIAELLES